MSVRFQLTVRYSCRVCSDAAFEGWFALVRATHRLSERANRPRASDGIAPSNHNGDDVPERPRETGQTAEFRKECFSLSEHESAAQLRGRTMVAVDADKHLGRLVAERLECETSLLKNPRCSQKGGPCALPVPLVTDPLAKGTPPMARA